MTGVRLDVLMTSAEHARLMRANQANWDARTPVHVTSRFYGLDEDLDPERWFAAFEWEDLGELSGRDVLHLQCHLGTETLALARRGARTVGLDFSATSVTAARDLAAKSGLDVTYVQANVYDAVAALEGRRFDVVYTGKGALCYLPDLDRWADVVAGLLRPGGRLYVVEFHPLLNALGPKPGPGEGPELLLRHDYLGGLRSGAPGCHLHLHRRPGSRRRHGQLRVDARSRRRRERVDGCGNERPATAGERRASLAALVADGPYGVRLVAAARAADPPPVRPAGRSLSLPPAVVRHEQHAWLPPFGAPMPVPSPSAERPVTFRAARQPFPRGFPLLPTGRLFPVVRGRAVRYRPV